MALGFFATPETPEERAAREARAEQRAAEREAIAAERAAEREARAAEEAAREAEEAAEEAENRRAGFHCLSFWDGSHPRVVTQVQASLNDPDSFKHDETRVTPVSDDGIHEFIMEFRARNGFGGTVRGMATDSYQSVRSGRILRRQPEAQVLVVPVLRKFFRERRRIDSNLGGRSEDHRPFLGVVLMRGAGNP